MEEGKKNRILLGAFILGIIAFVIWGVFLFTPLMVRTDGSGRDSFFSFLTKMIDSIKETGQGNLPLLVGIIIYILAAFISLITAILLNVLGWLKNDAKKILIAAILYIFSLTIPSSVMCFIIFAKINKKNGMYIKQ